MKMIPILRFASLVTLAVFLLLQPAGAATYTYTNSSANATDQWGAGTNWSAAPVSASDTQLTFISPNTTVFGDGLTINANNDNVGTFQLNSLTLQGTQSTTTNSTFNITGNALQFVSNNATTPVLNLNALSPNAGRLTYNISNNVAFANNTLITGNGSAVLNLTGTLSGTGSITKTGTSKVFLGNSTASNNLNNKFLYSGDINVNGGTLGTNNNGDLFTKSKLTITTGATFELNGNMAVFSIFGTAGTLGTASGGARTLYVNYTGTDPTAGFTGSITSSSSGVNVFALGSGNMTFGTFGSNTPGLTNVGTGTVTAVALSGANNSQGGVQLGTPLSTVKLTGNSGQINGRGTSAIAGTLIIAPSGTGANVTVTSQSAAATGSNATAQFRYNSAAVLVLDKGSNTSVNFQLGNSASTTNSTSPLLVRGSTPGTLVIDPVNGVNTLGGTAKLTLLNSTAASQLPVLTNTLVSTSVVVVDNDGTKKADFVTYNGTGISSDVGFQKANYTLTDTFSGSTNLSVVKITGNQTISGATSAFALRNDATITINSGQTLTLGNTVAGSSNSTNSPQTGLILNGGSIAGPGTLALGASEGMVYTSTAGGTISANVTGAGGTNSGTGTYSGTTPVSLNKFGTGTLFLTGTNSYGGATMISNGAVDVGAITATALSGSASNLTFNGGVLQGSGTFTRSLGTGNSQVTWNGINFTNSQKSGGFAARGGDLTVAIGGTVSPTALVWGQAPASQNFITESNGFTGILMFGSDTSTGQVDFRNAIDLGSVVGSPFYYRTINVAQGTGTDSAKLSGVISSTEMHGLLKTGAGKLILSGTNTYAGDTVVSAGTLLINGNQTAATGMTTVNSGAFLGGNGTIGGAVTISAGGTLSPGNSPGLLTINGPLTLAGDVAMEIIGTTRGDVLGYDAVNIGSSQLLTYGGTLTLTMTGAIANGTYDLFSFTSGFKTGNFSSIAFAGGYYTGTFNRVGDVWTMSVASHGQTFTFDQASGDLVVPEPSTWALLAFSMTTVMVLRRRRNAK